MPVLKEELSRALGRVVRDRGWDATRVAAELEKPRSTVGSKLNGFSPLRDAKPADRAFVARVLALVGATEADLTAARAAVRAELLAAAGMTARVAPSDAVTAPSPLAEGDPLIELPFAGLVPATDFDAELDGIDPLAVPARFGRRHRSLRFACRVKGRSCEPFIQQGDVVIFERDLAPPSGTFVLAQRRGDHLATLKLYLGDAGGEPHLVATDPATPDPDDGDGWGVIARLVGLWRDRGFKETIWHEDAGLTRRHFEA